MKAKEWHERGQQAADPINALAEFWRAFNNLYFPFKGGDERQKIRKCLGAKITEEQARTVLANRKKEIDVLIAKPIIDMRGNGRDTKPNIEAFNRANDPLTKLLVVMITRFVAIWSMDKSRWVGNATCSSARVRFRLSARLWRWALGPSWDTHNPTHRLMCLTRLPRTLAVPAVTNAAPNIPFWQMVFKNTRVFFLGSDDFTREAKIRATRDLNAALEADWSVFEIATLLVPTNWWSIRPSPGELL